MPEPARRPNRPLLIKLAIAAVALLVVAVLLARGFDLMGLIERGLALIRSAGPVAFFVAMALLPAVGAPATAFSLSAGPVFSEKLGLGPVIGFSVLAFAVNMALSYYLASRALRPLLEKLFIRLGYQLPKAESGDATDLIILLRVTPGVPFPVQNYLLGLAEVPFWKYLGLSVAIIGTYTAALVAFGDAILHGKAKVTLLGFLVLVVVIVGTHLLRKHYGPAKKQP